MKPYRIFFAAFLFPAISQAQVNISSGSYFQDFGTATISSWTNNSTFPGWYISGTFQGNANLSGSANSFNAGGFYAYNCGSDSKIGSRASGSASNLYYGVVLRNTTGQTIRSIRVSYTGYQMSLATNGNNINTIAFDYIVSTSAPSITASGGTSVPGLNFQQLQNSSTSGGSQLNWFPCTQSRSLSECIPVTIANNSYLLLRWRDVDDSGNDHHMAIDDIEVAFDMTGGTCAVFLPVELLYFQAKDNGQHVVLSWATAAEANCSHFTVERSSDGIFFEPLVQVKSAGRLTEKTDYTTEDLQPLEGLAYYRLRQTDVDGSQRYSPIQSVLRSVNTTVTLYPNPTRPGIVNVVAGVPGIITVRNAVGQTVLVQKIVDGVADLHLSDVPAGIYTVVIQQADAMTSQKLVVVE